MTFKSVRGLMKDTSEAECAKQVFDFFMWQYTEAMRESINEESIFRGFEAANAAAKREYEKVYEPCGWGPQLPYDQYALKRQKEVQAEASRNQMEAKALLDFVKNKLIDNLCKK